ncbi:MAG: hypothetical protein IKC57_02705 [Alistipes sp.]|nr:hypothetical protein [Alistipes sp.]
MINRILGTLFTLAALAIILFAILNRGNYRSMLFGKSEEPAVEITEGVTTEAAEAIDTAVEEAIPVEESSSEQVVEGENNVE